MARFSTTDWQTIKIYYSVKTNREFHPEDYDTSEKFDEKIANLVMANADGEIIDWEITDSDTNDTLLLTNTEYCIEIRARVKCWGTCYYDPGKTYGPPEDCYPPEIDDVEYEEGMITSAYVGEYSLAYYLPEIEKLNVNVGEVDGDGEIDIEDYD